MRWPFRRKSAAVRFPRIGFRLPRPAFRRTPTARRSAESSSSPGRAAKGRRLERRGHGMVYEVRGAPEMALMAFTAPVPGGVVDLELLARRRADVAGRLGGAAAVDLCWPQYPDAKGADLAGYVMPRYDFGYYFTAGRTSRRRKLDWAVRTPRAANMAIRVDDRHRVHLALLVARFLDAMHAAGLAHGDVSWASFSFKVEPEVRLCVDGFDSARIIGRNPFIGRPAAQTAEWADPRSPAPGPATFDSDRYRFALMAHRLLITRTLEASIGSARVPPRLPEFDERQVRDLRRLWERADGRIGTRPTMSEWVRVLEGR